MLLSTMMDWPLTVPAILERARALFPTREIVSVLPGGVDPATNAPVPVTHRTTYADTHARVMRLANALAAEGVGDGDRVATLALNHFRHLEAYFAIPATGAVCHTVNARLHPDQIAFIMNHAEDRVLLVDHLFLGLLPAIRARVPSLKRIVVMGGPPEALPDGTVDYEAFIAPHPTSFQGPAIDERQACSMCYTSGTTGHPKGVLYSHRAVVLHSLASMAADVLAVSERDSVLPIVPMFHVNAWGLPYTCALAGSKQVFAGAFGLDARLVARLIAEERVTFGAGVPTIWLALLDEFDRARRDGAPHDTSSLRCLLVGGSAAPRAMIEAFGERHDIHVQHAWGMTETAPLGTVNTLKPEHASLDASERYDRLALTGRAAPLLEIEIVNGDDRPLPHDGRTMGRLLIRGPWVTGAYYRDEAASAARRVDGWFDTADIATIDADGFMLIQDRAKDLIKSGGEWISSVDLENALMGHPAVKEAAVIAIPHPRWGERPLGVIVTRDGASVTRDELNAFLAPKFAKWWLPDDYAFVSAIPRTTVGKFLKRALREQFSEYRFPDA